jgi:lantibiotic modifying enzyme
MVLGAASLFERVQWTRSSHAPPPAPIPLLDTITEAWTRAYAPGNPAALLRRLAWDDLDPDAVRRALATADPEIPDSAAAWTSWIDRYLAACLEPNGGIDANRAEAPFVDVLWPALQAASRELETRTSLRSRARLAPAAVRELGFQLLKDLTAHCELALLDAFRHQEGSATEDPSSRDRYQRFVRSMRTGGLARLFEAHPVLARHVSLLLEAWVTTSAELLTRLDADVAAIEEAFGAAAERVIDIAPALSDPHNGRRRVVKLTFESGLVLLYKPRDLRLDQVFAEFLVELAALGLSPAPSAAATLPCDGYGWVEFVAREDIPGREHAADWYRRAGALLCIAHLLRGRDLHMENVVATARGPVLIDLELLLQPVSAREQAGSGSAPDGTQRPAGASCLTTGFVSDLHTSAEGTLFDVGGLRGDGEGRTPVNRRVWTGLGSDAISYTTRPEFRIDPLNRPVCGGEPLAAEDHVDDILAGFEGAYRLIHRRREEIVRPGGALDRFAGRTTRVIGRPTDQYAAMLHLLAAPRYQQSGVLRSVTLDALNRAFVTADTKPPLWPLAQEERQDLERLDVPVFHARTDERAVYHGTRQVVPEQFAASGLDAARQRIASMDDADMDVQLSALQRALWDPLDARFETPLVLPSPPHGTSLPPGAEVVAHALWIAEEMAREGLEPEGTTRTTDFHLYDGRLGPALFHAAVAATTGDAAFRALALAAVDRLAAVMESDAPAAPLGICSGDGSLIYATTCIGRLLGESSPAELAGRLAERITADRIEADDVLDVSGGAAGAALALLAFHQHSGDPHALAGAIACGERLLASAQHDGAECSWTAADGRRYVGFAHGAAGIAVALIRLFRATGRQDFLAAAAGAHRFERRLYQKAAANWPVAAGDDGGPGEMMTAWCHGAPGMALARSLAATSLQDASLLADVTAALKTTAAVPVRLDDHLCCGSMGRCDVLLTAGETLRAPAAVEAAWRIALAVVGRAAAEGRYRLTSRGYEFRAFDAGFFRGLSGIGYQLLRLAAPSRLPSILAFELPSTASRS